MIINKSIIFSIVFCFTAIPARVAGAVQDSCRACHKDPKFKVQNRKIYDYYEEWKGSAHDLAGVGCIDCHGGDANKTLRREAHAGILAQSDPASPVNYKNIPKTCGKCHAAILKRFKKSRHYQLLESTGKGPSCITCHGSLNAKAYYTTIIGRACATCHNKRGEAPPEIIPQAQDILSRLNHAKGYRQGLKFYYDSIGKPGAMESVDSLYGDVVRLWHEFNFKTLDQRSKDLAVALKAIYAEAQRERAARKKTRPETKN